MKNIIFDMETGDPDDIITLLLLLNNPQVNLKAVTCYEGSPHQLGLIHKVIEYSGQDIPIGGWNTPNKELNPFYYQIFENWEEFNSNKNPVEILEQYLNDNTILLTGAPLTNISLFLQKNPNKTIQKMITQGGYLGKLVKESIRLEKFKNRQAIRTYNLTSDADAFDIINYSTQITDLTYVTKDLCHGFTYNQEIHNNIIFENNKIAQTLKKSLNYYASKNINKALHDPLAMIYLINPSIGERQKIQMSHFKEKNNIVFSSELGNNDSFTYGLIEYNKELAWNEFKKICQSKKPQNKKSNP